MKPLNKFPFAHVVVVILLLIPIMSSAVGRNDQDAKLEQDPCNLTAKAGICEAYFRRWYYDLQADQCQEFVYGGCGGNANNFETREECRKFRVGCLRKRGYTGQIPPERPTIHF